MFVGRRHSQFHCKTDKKSEKCAVLKPLVSTVRPLQKDISQETNLEQRSDSCISEQLHSAPKRRKTCGVKNVSSPTMSRVVSSADSPLFKSMSALSIRANSMFILMILKSKRLCLYLLIYRIENSYLFCLKVESL